MSADLRSQIKGLDIEVSPSFPPRELSRFDDFTLVTGLRTGHDLLFVGGNAYLPAVKRCVRSVTTAKNRRELEKFMSSGHLFDRIFIIRENVIDERLIDVAAVLLARGGLVCFFSDVKELRDGFSGMVEESFPASQVWKSATNVGPVVMTDLAGERSRGRDD